MIPNDVSDKSGSAMLSAWWDSFLFAIPLVLFMAVWAIVWPRFMRKSQWYQEERARQERKEGHLERIEAILERIADALQKKD